MSRASMGGRRKMHLHGLVLAVHALLMSPSCGFLSHTSSFNLRYANSASSREAFVGGVRTTSFSKKIHWHQHHHLRRPRSSSRSSPSDNTARRKRGRQLSMTSAQDGGSFFEVVTEFFEDLQKIMDPAGSAKDAAAELKSAMEKDEMQFDGIWVMMNGLSGKMGVDVSAACLRKGFRIAPYALSGKGTGEITVKDDAGKNATSVTLVPGDDEEGCEEAINDMKRRCSGGRIVVVDYTQPTAVNRNAEFYAKHGLDFVMGTTGGDRDALMSVTETSGVYAVIAPNMGKQIVALQTAIDNMATEFPGAFGDYKLEITESHQSAKVDTSGTAKALAADFATLTAEDYNVKSINKIRDREEQLAFGVPEEHLAGHAFHTYSLKSNDGTVEFQFRHNVCGRRMYAEGTADAVEFLAKQADSGADKRVYNMLDVLRQGGM